MTRVRKTSSVEAVRSPSPPPAPKSDRELRPLPHRSPSSATVLPNVLGKVAPRPPLLREPSMSQFRSELGASKTGYRYSVAGNCQSCMACARDAYDKMHAEHVSAESKASGR